MHHLKRGTQPILRCQHLIGYECKPHYHKGVLSMTTAQKEMVHGDLYAL
jgi:hypothetical protein